MIIIIIIIIILIIIIIILIQSKNIERSQNTNLQAHAIIDFLKLADKFLASV